MVKFLIVYTKYTDNYIVGFANSLEEFIELNSKRNHPYNYDDKHLKLIKLKPDVFAMASIEGMSNFVDYLK